MVQRALVNRISRLLKWRQDGEVALALPALVFANQALQVDADQVDDHGLQCLDGDLG
jgi:hypothetical protein